jgi:hypothetical protein
MSLTGDELTLNDKSYSIKDRNGNDFYLGKLIAREKSYNYYKNRYSIRNNIFQFENMPDKESYKYPLGLSKLPTDRMTRELTQNIIRNYGPDAFFLDPNYYDQKMFDEVATVGGKKKSKKRRTKKRRTKKRRTKKGRKNRRKLTRRR